jgi:hypothetical protein
MTLTAAGDIIESQNLINMNVPPILMPTSGEGAPCRLFSNDDYVSPTSANVQFSTYTLGPRIPTNAKIKKVMLYTKGIDTNASQTCTYDINLIFSDAPLGGIAAGQPVNDGTTLTNAGQIPTSALTGAVTSITAYASPNKMFGSAVTLAASGAVDIQEVTYKNTFTFADRFLPLWDVLGYTVDPGGAFNFFIVQEANSATAAAGTLGLIVDYAF